MIDHDRMTPESYARKLAAYISDPSTIRVRTIDYFGKAPSLQKCAELRRMALHPSSSDERRMARMREYNPFDCGHNKDASNTLIRDGREECKKCRRELEATATRRHKERLRRMARGKPALAISDQPLFSSDIIKAVANAFLIEPEDILSPSRQIHHVCARSVAAMLFRERGQSLPQIAQRLNRKCHSTIKNLVDTFDARCRQYPEIKQAYERLRG